MHLIVPFIDRCGPEISLKEKVADFPPQPIITKDNVPYILDWSHVTQGSAAADAARTYFIIKNNA